MLPAKALDYAACVARVFPGWVHVLERNNMSPTTHIAPMWELMPATYRQCLELRRWGHPGGLHAIMNDPRFARR